MSFQTIFEVQQSMTVNNRRTVGQQVSRSGQVRVAQYLTAVPWVFTVSPHAYLPYATSRDIIQTIDNLDRQLPETITFNSANLSWFTAYQGSLTIAQANALTLAAVPAANSQIISVGNLPSVASTRVVFKAGDFLQMGNYSYKVREDVLRGVNTTVSVGLHRPVIGTVSVGTLTNVGNDCTFTVLAEKCPTYTLMPAPGSAFVQWDEAFVFREDITG
jgi:hypothetical protein